LGFRHHGIDLDQASQVRRAAAATLAAIAQMSRQQADTARYGHHLLTSTAQQVMARQQRSAEE
jgi:hypothetical protein